MNEALARLLAWVAGVLLGAMFFGGLWWTVRKAMSSPHPARWLFSSLVVRMTTALAGLYFVSNGHLGRLLLCLLGVVTARPVVTRLTRTSDASHAA